MLKQLAKKRAIKATDLTGIEHETYRECGFCPDWQTCPDFDNGKCHHWLTRQKYYDTEDKKQC